MSGRAARHYWEDVGLMKLVGAFLLAPFAWLLDLEVSYATVKWACENDARYVLLLVPIASLSMIAVAGWMSWSCWRSLHGQANLQGPRMEDRSYFLAFAGLAMTAVFGLLIITSLAPRYFLSPCE